MPKLNRIRIANVSYDGKHIIDQTYDTYGGENTLFNLANGSGKSVLVQMMMQPILPRQRIQDRKIESYLSKSSSPTYIMLEWKLDHTVMPLYYLTGIAMCSVPQSDESMTRVKYFTFTYKYDSATDYDIANTPLIRHESGTYRFMPYDEALKLLKNVRGETHPLNCYTRDSSDAYKKDLGSHGIFADEWRLLARINNWEGGVDKVFEDCKSSDALLNEWILGTISEKAGQSKQKLGEMFFKLIDSVLSQEETLAEKELLVDFLQDVDVLIESLSELLRRLENIEDIKQLLAGLYQYLSRRVSDIDDEKQICADKELELDAVRKQIQYERLSDFWHSANESFLHCKEMLDQKMSAADSRRVLHDKAKRDREIMEAAGYSEKKRDADDTIAALREQLTRFLEGQTNQEAQDVLFSLDSKYTALIKEKQEALRVVAEEIENAEGLLNEYKDETRLISAAMQEISEASGRVVEKLAAFEKYEADCQKQLGIGIRRTLAFQLSEDEVESAKKHLQAENDRLTQEEVGLRERLRADLEKRAALDESWKKLTEELGDIDRRIERRKDELALYEKAVETFKEIAARRGAFASIKNIADIIRSFKENEIQIRAEQYDWNAQLIDERAVLARFEADCLHTAPVFIKLLESNNISFITGENYLKAKTVDEQMAALSKNPMLPFCILVGNADFETAVALRTEGIDRVCPVLILENAEENMGAGNRAIPLTDFGRILCHYFEESFTPDKRDEFKSRLEESITSTKNKYDEWSYELGQLGNDIAFLEGFPYDNDSGRTLRDGLEALLSERQTTINRRDSEKLEAENLASSCDRLREDIVRCRECLRQAGDNLVLFDEYVSEDAKYVKNLEEQQRLSRDKEKHARRFSEIGEEIEILRGRQSEAEVKKSGLHEQIEQLEIKHRAISAPGSGHLLDWPLDALERRYEEIKYKQSQDEKAIRQEITHNEEKRAAAEKSLGKFRHITAHEMENTSFDENRLASLEREEARCGQLLADADKERDKANSEYIRADAERSSCRKRLADEGWDVPLAKQEVIGDYAARTALLDESLAQIVLRKNELDGERDKCQRDINRIISIVGDPEYTDMQPPEGGWVAVNIGEQSSLHKHAQSTVDRLRSKATEMERDLKLKFSQQHSGIDHILMSLAVADCALNLEACRFAFERLSEQRELMHNTVLVLESDLEQLSIQKEHVVYHAFTQGKMLHAELKKISESSRVKLDPGKPARQTLKIGVPDELDPYAEERVREHVNACITDMRRSKKEGLLTEKSMRSFMNTKLSDREILNKVIGQHMIDVWLIKVDAFHANTKLRIWESVRIENSGGELFISCFALLSALMDYSRASIPVEGSSKSGAKVMLIDNPFGKTSSAHLLEALIQVAKRFNMQIICLSDLSQSSITAKFSLIYQLSLRPAMYSGKSYLKIDSFLNNATLSPDSRLEHVSLKNEQMSIF